MYVNRNSKSNHGMGNTGRILRLFRCILCIGAMLSVATGAFFSSESFAEGCSDVIGSRTGNTETWARDAGNYTTRITAAGPDMMIGNKHSVLVSPDGQTSIMPFDWCVYQYNQTTYGRSASRVVGSKSVFGNLSKCRYCAEWSLTSLPWTGITIQSAEFALASINTYCPTSLSMKVTGYGDMAAPTDEQLWNAIGTGTVYATASFAAGFTSSYELINNAAFTNSVRNAHSEGKDVCVGFWSPSENASGEEYSEIWNVPMLYVNWHDDQAPCVELTYPCTGAQLMMGLAATITWVASDNAGVSAFTVELTRDGVSWTTIATVDGSARSCNWTVTGPTSSSCTMRITATDGANTSTSTSGVFTIKELNPPQNLVAGLVSVQSKGTVPGNGDSWYLHLSWDYPYTAGLTCYEGQWRFPPDPNWSTFNASISPGAIGWTHTNYQFGYGVTIGARIRARHGDVYSPWSNESYVTTPQAPPEPIGHELDAVAPFGAKGESAMLQNMPNPFRESTVIRYQARQAGNAGISVYDVRGRAVKVLVAGQVAKGVHSVSWDGKDERGRRVPAGVYLCQYRIGDRHETKKMVIMQ